MLQENRLLYDEIAKLPLEKIGKALSYVRYLEREVQEELFLDPAEEAGLHEILVSGDFVSSEDLFAKINRLPNG